MAQKSIVSVIDQYFKRFPHRNIEIESEPSRDLRMSVVIPVYNEDDLTPTLTSLFFNQKDFSFNVEIIILINNSIEEKLSIIDNNISTYNYLLLFAKKYNNNNITLLPIYINDLPIKHAGVGWARKLGMDLALKRFAKIAYNGIIVGLDADTVVAENYFSEIASFFSDSDTQAASIHFEHPTKGTVLDNFNYEQIKYYETHLRYYKNILTYAGLPYSYHTIGSAFALTAKAYARQGGMNRRKAGEDFYFINKLIKGENFSEITNTMVFPSPRTSNRVPFGTGKAILEALKNHKDLTLTYDFKIFETIKQWVYLIKNEKYEYCNFPILIREFLTFKEWELHHELFLKNSSKNNNFIRMFFLKFDAFWMLKFTHFSRDSTHENSCLKSNTNLLLEQLGYSKQQSLEKQLDLLRTIDKKRG